MTLDPAGGKNTYKVNVAADGQIASGNTGIVTGDTVHKKFEEFANTTNTQLSGFAKTDGSNIDVDNGQWLMKLGSSSSNPIVEGNKHFVTGEQLAVELRPKGPGNYIDSSQTVGDCLQILDEQIKGLASTKITEEGAISLAQEAVTVTEGNHVRVTKSQSIGGKSTSYEISISDDGTVGGNNDTHLVTGTTVKQAFDDVFKFAANTNTTYRDAVRQQAMEAVKIAVDGPLTLNSSPDVANQTKTYTLGVKADGTVEDKNTGLVTGGEVYKYMQNFTANQGYVTPDGANIDVDGTGSKWLTKLGTQVGTTAISDANKHFVTGHEVFNETHVDMNGTFVKTASSTKDNLKALDQNLAVVVNANGTLKVAATDLSNVKSITGDGLTAVRGSIAFDDNDFVTVTHAKDNAGAFKVNLTTTGTDRELNATNRLVTSVTLDAVLKTKNGELEQTISQTYAKTDASNIATDKWLDKLGSKADAISATNTHFVMGSQVAAETRVNRDGKYVKATNSAADNLNLLDNQLFANTEALQTKVNKTEVSSLAQEAVKVTAGKHVVVNSATALDKSSVSYEVDVKTDDSIAQGGTGLVTSGTVYDYVKDFTTGQGYATTTGSNIVVDSNGEWFKKLGTTNGTTAISQGNTHFVSGKEVFDEVRVKNDGTSIKQANTAAQNFDALDKALANKIDKGTIGTEVGQVVAIESTDDFIKVQKSGNAKYQLSLKTTESKDLAETENALVTRNSLKTKLTEAEKATQTKLDAKADLDAKNLQPEHITQWQAKLGDGQVVANNQGLVTGKTVYDEVRVKADGTYVQQAKSAGENITALDTKLQKVRDDLYGSTDGTTQTLQLAKTDLSNMTILSESGMMAIGKSLKFADQDQFVKIGFDEQSKSFKVEVTSTGTEDAKTGLDATKPNRLVTTTTLNSALDQKKGEIEGAIQGTYAKIDASNIQDMAWLQTLGTQDKVASISDANDHFVTGKEVYKEVRPSGTLHYTATDKTTGENLAALDGKLNEARKALYGETDGTTPTLQLAKRDLSNITAEGKTAISRALTFEQGDFVNIAFDETKNSFKVAITSTGEATSLDATNKLVTSKTLNSVLTANKNEITGTLDNTYVKVDASNITNNLDAWYNALGASSIDANGKGFVTAKQMFDWGNPVAVTRNPFNVIQSGLSVGQNLVLIDKTLGEHATSIESLKTQSGGKLNLTVAQNGLLELKDDGKGGLVLDIKQGDVTNSADGKGTGVVTGEKVQMALDDLNTKIDTNIQTSINQKLEGDEFKQLVNNAVDQTIINQKVDEAMKNLVTDKITENDKKAVTSGAVHSALYSDSVHFGKFSESKGQYSTAVGYNSKVNANKAGAFGVDNSIAAGADNSYVVGMNNKLEASAKDTFVLGSGVTTGASNAVVLGAGSEGVDNAVSVGSSKNKRKIVNVADGKIAEGSSDAVTGGQLYETQQAIANNQRSINQVANTLHKEINRAAANSAAMAALQPIGLDDEHHWSAAAGVGHYSGEQAVAVGLFYKPTQNFMVNMGGSTTVHGDPMVNFGVSYRFGAPYTNDAMSTGELQQKVVALNNQNLALEAQLESARSRENNMVKRVEKSKQELEALRAEIEQMKELLGLKAKMQKTSAKH